MIHDGRGRGSCILYLLGAFPIAAYDSSLDVIHKPHKDRLCRTVVPALVLFASSGNSASFRVLMAVSVYTGERDSRYLNSRIFPQARSREIFRKSHANI